MNNWVCLILSLPTENTTLRQRTWRTLKASGAAVLRDGVYLMPNMSGCKVTLEGLATEVKEGGGTALVMQVEEPPGTDFISLFNRGADYGPLLTDIANARAGLRCETIQDALKLARKLRKTFVALEAIDFFAGEAHRQAELSLRELEHAIAQTVSPNEPQAIDGAIASRSAADFQKRTWATRQRPWVDRLASAWLIRRFIDPRAKFVWLERIEDCPPDALGFDFDGATFTHMGSRVTFEVLVASFGLAQAALSRLGLLVHYLDAGGAQPAEAAGVESVLAGLHASITHDDQLLQAASLLFDGLLHTFSQEVSQ